MPRIGSRLIPDLKEAQLPHEPGANGATGYQLELITPLVGGSAKAATIDTRYPVRGSGIRGQLRFWWRLLNRNSFVENGALNVAAMRAAEFAIWGSTKSPGNVVIDVNRDSGDLATTPFGAGNANNFVWNPPFDSPELQYVAFPFKPHQNEAPNTPVKHFLAPGQAPGFALSISRAVPAGAPNALNDGQWSQVQSAVRAWISFGGIGARTRRGFGAIRCLNADFSPANSPPSGCRLLVHPVAANNQDSIAAWRKCARTLWEFRQGGRGNNGRGRSRWPEPDSLRAAWGHAAPNHGNPVHPDHVGTFPRAALGLPIVFHFKDHRDGDPGDITLNPFLRLVDGQPSGDRMASPILIRPVHFEGTWCAGVLVLPPSPGWHTLSAYLTDLRPTAPGPSSVGNGSIMGPGLTILPPMENQKNAVDAFVQFALNHQFELVAGENANA